MIFERIVNQKVSILKSNIFPLIKASFIRYGLLREHRCGTQSKHKAHFAV